MKKALITGISGQDGSYLANFLLGKDYEVHGTTRQYAENSNKLWRISENINQIKVHQVNPANIDNIEKIFELIMPDEVYHLASDVEPRVIFEQEKSVFDINFLGSFGLLHSIKKFKPSCRLYCAGSSLMFGAVTSSPQNEETPLNPTTPYGIAKVAAYHFARMHRQVYGTYACTGILFNHESPKRNENFLPRKISKAVANIKCGKQSKLILGDINVKRDWAYAGDVVESMWLMLQQVEPKDYVIGTGELHSVKEILEIAFNMVDLKWENYVEFDQALVRNVEYVNLCADSKRAKDELGWVPKVKFQDLIKTMVKADMNSLRSEND